MTDDVSSNNKFNGAFIEINASENLFPTNRTLLPASSSLSKNEKVSDDVLYLSGANRGANVNTITGGMLKSITYPTGGKTEFEFEAHTQKEMTYPPSDKSAMNAYSIHVINNGNPTYSTTTNSFTVAKETKAKIEVYITAQDYYDKLQLDTFEVILNLGSSVKTYSFLTLTDAQKNQFNQSHSITIDDDIVLPAGNITLSTVVPAGMPYQGYNLSNGVEATLTYSTINDDAFTGEGEGGGVRIKKITNYTDNNTISSAVKYNYVSTDNSSSGKMIEPLKFSSDLKKIYVKEGAGLGSTPIFSFVRNESRVSSSNMYNSSALGSNEITGYDRVEIEKISSDAKDSTGKRIVEFVNNKPVGIYTDIPFFFPQQNSSLYGFNGKLSSTVLLNKNLDTLRVEKFTNVVSNPEFTYMNVNVTDLYEGPTNGCEYKIANMKRFAIVVYPTVSYSVQLTTKETVDYLNNRKVSVTTSYEYDPLNYHEKKITETLGDKKRITEYKYPLNYGSGDFYYQPAMVSLNMVGIPIEEFTTIGTTPVLSKQTEFWKFGNLIAPSDILIKNGTGAYENRLKFVNYDSFGNPLYISKDNADNIVYLWSYNYQYPIAEIKGITYSDVTGKIAESTLNSIAAKGEPTDTDMNTINSLRNSLPNALVTTYTYKPLVGMATMTDPRGVVTKYDYDSFGRLNKVTQADKTIEYYDYHYKN